MPKNIVSEYRGFNIVKVVSNLSVTFHANGVPGGMFLASYPQACEVTDAWIERRDCKHPADERLTRDDIVWCGFCGEDQV